MLTLLKGLRVLEGLGTLEEVPWATRGAAPSEALTVIPRDPSYALTLSVSISIGIRILMASARSDTLGRAIATFFG